jgi:hypothetical protein
MTDPGFNRWTKDGMFKVVLTASSVLRSNMGNDTIYLLSDKGYDNLTFNTKFYDEMASSIVRRGLPELARSSMINPDLQQEQMKRNRYFMPEQDIKEDLELMEKKKAIIELQNSKLT